MRDLRELERYRTLLDRGVLSENEYNEVKQTILNEYIREIADMDFAAAGTTALDELAVAKDFENREILSGLEYSVIKSILMPIVRQEQHQNPQNVQHPSGRSSVADNLGVSRESRRSSDTYTPGQQYQGNPFEPDSRQNYRQRRPEYRNDSHGDRAAEHAPISILVLSFLIPIVGIVLFFVHRSSKPIAAGEEIKWAAIGMFVSFIMRVTLIYLGIQ